MLAQTVSIGDINERGQLRGMRRRGYTPAKCLLELIANSIDSHIKNAGLKMLNKKILFKLARHTIKLMDNAKGMNREGSAAMFSIHSENHSEDPSLGVSGVGSKPAMLILSEDTLVVVQTRQINGDYLAIEVPWDQIIKEWRQTGMVKVRTMTDEERKEFIEDRATSNMLHAGQAFGTTIQFKSSDGLKDLIENNFRSVDEGSLVNPLDRIACVFGRFNDISFEKVTNSDTEVLKLQNYFGGAATEYQGGAIRHDRISHHRSSDDKQDRFIWSKDGLNYEIGLKGRGWHKEPKKMVTGLHGQHHVGDFTVETGCREHSSIFNQADPRELDCNGFNHPDVTAQIGSSPDAEFLGSTQLIRNNQLIGLIPPADFTISSARASAATWLENILTQQNLCQNPISEQDNPQDIALGIQENKNQFDGKAVPLTLTRLCRAIRKEQANKLQVEFQDHIVRSRPPPPVPEEETEREVAQEAQQGVEQVAEQVAEEAAQEVAETPEETAEPVVEAPAPPSRKSKAPIAAPAPVPAPAEESATEETESEEAQSEEDDARVPHGPPYKGSQIQNTLRQIIQTVHGSSDQDSQEWIDLMDTASKILDVPENV